MSLWLEVFCQQRLGKIEPEAMLEGIGKRLELLTYLYCPDDEEEPEVVLKRIKIRSDPKVPRVLYLHARKEPEKFIRIDYGPVSAGYEVVQEKLERLARLPDQANPDLQRVQEFLKATQEAVGFQLLFSDMDTMGWPVAVAAAAWIAERGNGIMRSDSGEWMLPSEREVAYIFDERPTSPPDQSNPQPPRA